MKKQKKTEDQLRFERGEYDTAPEEQESSVPIPERICDLCGRRFKYNELIVTVEMDMVCKACVTEFENGRY